MTGHAAAGRWVRTHEDGLKFIEKLDGVDWCDAPLPRRWHTCTAQNRGVLSDRPFYRCACGGASYDGHHWMDRNSRPEPATSKERAMTETTPPVFDEWAIVELFGHQRFAGRIRQAEWPPGFARLEIPATDGHDAVTQLLSPQSIYRLTPTTEEIATTVAAQCRPEPVRRWELTSAADPTPSPASGDWDEHDGDGAF